MFVTPDQMLFLQVIGLVVCDGRHRVFLDREKHVYKHLGFYLMQEVYNVDILRVSMMAHNCLYLQYFLTMAFTKRYICCLPANSIRVLLLRALDCVNAALSVVTAAIYIIGALWLVSRAQNGSGVGTLLLMSTV